MKATKKIRGKYAKIRRKKVKSQKIIESSIVNVDKENKILNDLDTVEQVRKASDKKRTKILADQILKKYKNMKKPKKTYLVDDLLEEESVRGESILEATNKVLDFK